MQAVSGDFVNEHSATTLLCQACQLAPPPFARVVSFASYGGKLRLAIHLLKYTRIRPVSRPLGRLLAQAIATLADEAPRQMLVIPVPLHPRRSRARGFNQARLLAQSALRPLRRIHPDWRLTLSPASLVRQRETAPQVLLSPNERQLNLEQAFHVARPAQVRDRAILLIDDIVTTGATARACAQALLEAGASSVYVVSLARAQMEMHSERWTPQDESDAFFAIDFAPLAQPGEDTAAPAPSHELHSPHLRLSASKQEIVRNHEPVRNVLTRRTDVAW